MRAALVVALVGSVTLGFTATLITASPAQAQDGSGSSATHSSAPLQTDTQRRAVFFCNADQRDDELRNGYPTYTCDQFTGEKKPVLQTIIIDHDGHKKMVYPGQPQN